MVPRCDGSDLGGQRGEGSNGCSGSGSGVGAATSLEPVGLKAFVPFSSVSAVNLADAACSSASKAQRPSFRLLRLPAKSPRPWRQARMASCCLARAWVRDRRARSSLAAASSAPGAETPATGRMRPGNGTTLLPAASPPVSSGVGPFASVPGMCLRPCCLVGFGTACPSCPCGVTTRLERRCFHPATPKAAGDGA